MPFTFADHTSEVTVSLRASTLPGLFEEAARALLALAVDELPDTPPGPPEAVELSARDLEGLLVAWIDELVVRSEIDHVVFDEVTVHEVARPGCRLRATVRGRPVERLRTAVKAATFHDLRVEHDAEGWRADVTLDV